MEPDGFICICLHHIDDHQKDPVTGLRHCAYEGCVCHDFLDVETQLPDEEEYPDGTSAQVEEKEFLYWN